MARRSFRWALGAALAAASAVPAALAQETPASQTLLVLTGSAPNAHLGAVVGSAGDADGDGRGDFVAGSENLLTVVSGATGRVLYTIPADQPGDFTQATAFAVNDVDGDGRADIVVAAPFADLTGQPDAGAVYLFSGATGQRLWGAPGPSAGARFGASAALLGDLTGDGTPTLVVGAPGTAPNGLAEAGSAFILSLTSGQVLRTFSGSEAGGRLGSAVAGVGDLTGDGRPEFAVSAPQRSFNGQARAGVVFLISAVEPRTLSRFFGLQPDTQLGTSLANIGDVNGDSRADLAIGAPGRAVGGGAGAGVVFVFSMADRRMLYQLAGTAAGEGFGTVVAGGGDVNGDGRPDLVVGAPHAAVEGRADAGRVQVFSGPDGRPLLTLAGNTGDQLGSAVAFAGDVNGDGRADLVLGAPLFDALTAPDVGIVAVVSSPGPATGPPPPTNPSGPTTPTGPTNPDTPL
jgi:FG-GAP repeat